MIWFDLVTPKSVLFFKKMIKGMQERGIDVLVTAREGQGYHEVVDLLCLHGIEFFNRGYFGGANLGDKLKASIHRQLALMEFIEKKNIEKLVCLCSVDANRVAFGLGIPIVNFYDIPLSDWRTDFTKALPQARLTLPLSHRAFRPYMVPEEIFLRFGLEQNQIRAYQFLDVLIWLQDFRPSREFYEAVLKSYDRDPAKPTIVVREEEFKASYVMKKFPILYEGLKVIAEEMDVNIVAIPRYESGPLREILPFAAVLEEKMVIQHLLAYADLFIGGGGTLNSEACYFGTPTISTRSFVSHYDKLLIDENMMEKVDTVDELIEKTKTMLGKRNDPAPLLSQMSLDLDHLIDQILG